MANDNPTQAGQRPLNASQLQALELRYKEHLTRTIAAIDLRKWVVEQVLENLRVGMPATVAQTPEEPGHYPRLTETIMRQSLDPETILRLITQIHDFVSAPIGDVELKLSVE